MTSLLFEMDEEAWLLVMLCWSLLGFQYDFPTRENICWVEPWEQQQYLKIIIVEDGVKLVVE